MEQALWFALALGVVLMVWRSGVDAQTAANAAAIGACREAGVQFLDGTVVLGSWRLTRSDSDRLALRRTYSFDYSDDGVSRRQGFVVTRGHDIELVGLGPTLVRTHLH